MGLGGACYGYGCVSSLKELDTTQPKKTIVSEKNGTLNPTNMFMGGVKYDGDSKDVRPCHSSALSAINVWARNMISRLKHTFCPKRAVSIVNTSHQRSQWPVGSIDVQLSTLGIHMRLHRKAQAPWCNCYPTVVDLHGCATATVGAASPSSRPNLLTKLVWYDRGNLPLALTDGPQQPRLVQQKHIMSMHAKGRASKLPRQSSKLPTR